MPIQKPVNVDFGDEGDACLLKFVEDNVMSLKQQLTSLHEEKVNKWRRLYRGVPKEEKKNFPWKNASNVVVQLIGDNCDTIRARILGTIFEVMPLWTSELIGDFSREEDAGGQQEVVQSFLNYVGMEPTELDLYRVESQGTDDCVKFGTVMYSLPWIMDIEAECIGEAAGKTAFREVTRYEGPRPEKLEFENWAATPSAPTLEQADFKYKIISLKKQQLEERFFHGVYKFKAKEGTTAEEQKEQFLTNPDRPGRSVIQTEKDMDKGIMTPAGDAGAEWDVYECWFPYFKDGKKYRLIYSIHLASKTCLRAIYNFYPNNEEPWEMSRFGYTDDGLYGFGLCEMLEHYQAEVTTMHNQRADNRTLANTSIFRVDPNSKLDAIFSVYPNALIPANEGELEKIQLGSVYNSSVEEEQLTLSLAKSRAGTDDPGFSGAGGGTVSKKGAYSSMGTFSVMQAGNRRVNLNITDMRYTHHKLGRKFLSQYAEFGIGERAKAFGNKAALLKKALQNVKAGKLILPIRAATASINKELEKQNDMLLTQVMQRHHQGIAQILQSLASPQVPPEMKQFMIGWIDSSSIIMGRILRNFGHDDLSRLLPERKLLEGASNNGGQQGGGNSGAGAARSVEQNNPTNSVVPSTGAASGSGDGLDGQAGGGSIPGVSG